MAKMSTGALLTSYDAHYRAITCLAWTNDDAALVSGSEDALLHVWSLPGSVSCSSQCLAQAEYPAVFQRALVKKRSESGASAICYSFRPFAAYHRYLYRHGHLSTSAVNDCFFGWFMQGTLSHCQSGIVLIVLSAMGSNNTYFTFTHDLQLSRSSSSNASSSRSIRAVLLCRLLETSRLAR